MAAADFLDRWDFEAYKLVYRKQDVPSRSARLAASARLQMGAQ